MTAARFEALARAIANEPPPCAFVDLDALDRNAACMARAAQGVPIRLATKSIRSRALLEDVLARHQAFVGLLAYSAREACFLAEHGFDDLVVAYPTADEAELLEVARHVAVGASITLSVDSVAHVERLARVAAGARVTLPVCLDVDASTRFPGLVFGVRRSPIAGVEEALRVVSAIERSDWLQLDGVLAYEAQIAGVRDRIPADASRSRLMRALKRLSMVDVVARRRAIVDAIRARVPLRFVNGGGTGSLAVSSRDASLTELAAGSGLFTPTLFDGYDALPLEPAAFFALSVSRVHDARIVVCSGGGYVASGPGGPDRMPVPVHPPGGALLAHEGAGEVQTPVEYPTRGRPSLGDRVLFRHAKSGELCERFETLALVRGGAVVDRVTTYRGDGVSFF